jgi:hypothetical protein
MTDSSDEADNRPTAMERAWAIVRILVGFGQVTGAVVSFCLLLLLGINELSVGWFIATCVLMTVSLILFGKRR